MTDSISANDFSPLAATATVTPTATNRVVHFHIPGSDLPVLADFYRNAFGWQVEDWSEDLDFGFWGIRTGSGYSGIDGGLVHVQNDPAQRNGTAEDLLTRTGRTFQNRPVIYVDSISEIAARVEEFGGSIGKNFRLEKAGFEFQEVWDPEGNLLILANTDSL